MKFLILGDVHGDWAALNLTIARAIRKHADITHIVQVGDFGYAWPGIKPFKFSRAYFTNEQIDELENEIEKLWLDGNHECFSKLNEDHGSWQPGWTWMSRGTIKEIDGYRVMFFGGATSYDKSRRIIGTSWWPDESITYTQTMAALEKGGTIDALFSHEHPASVPYSDECYPANDIVGKGDRDSLQALVEKFKPKFSFFGHHHRGDHGVVDDMLWTCCPVVDRDKPLCYTIWDGKTVSYYWEAERRRDARKRGPYIC